MSSLRPPEGGEIYIFPDITVGPSSVSEQYGVEPGEFLAADSNGSQAEATVIGTIRELVDEGEFPVIVTAEGRASLPALGDRNVGRVRRGVGVRGTQILVTGTQTPVSRFSVTRNGRKFGIRTASTRRPTDNVIATPGSRTPAGLRGGVLVEDPLGRLVYVELLNVNATSSYQIRVLRYSQAANGPQGDWAEVAGTSGITLTNLTEPSIAACFFQGDLYFVVTSRDAGTFQTLRADAAGAVVSLGITVTPSPGLRINGGASMIDCGSHVLLALGMEGALSGLGTDKPREIHIMRSSDMMTWYAGHPDDTTSSSLSGYRLTTSPETATEINAIDMSADGLTGFAVGYAQIHFTQDGGKSWTKQPSPVGHDLLAVRVIGENEDGKITAYVCGDGGTILRTNNSGEEWKILTTSQTATAPGGGSPQGFYDETQLSTWRGEVGDTILHAIVSNGSDVWVGGYRKFVYIGGLGLEAGDEVRVHEINLRSLGTVSSYVIYGMVMVPGSSEEVILLGDFLKGFQRFRAVRVPEAADNEVPDVVGEAAMTNVDPREFRAGVGRTEPINGAVVACGQKGLFAYRNNDGTWVLPTVAVTLSNLVSIDVIHDLVDTADNEIVIGTETGRVLRSSDNGVSWVGQQVSGRQVSVYAVALPESGISLAGAAGIYRSEEELGFRALPELIKLPNGEILLAADDLTGGTVELFFSRDEGATFDRGEPTGALGEVNFTAQTDPDVLDATTPRLSMFFVDSGELCLSAGPRMVVSPDGVGARWVASDSGELPLPIQARLPTAIGTTNEQSFKVLRAYGGMRIFGVLRASDGSRTFTMREWIDNSTVYPPIVPGKPAYVGIGDMKVLLSANSAAIGDQWESQLAYQYPASNVAEDTRSTYWRGKPRLALEAPEMIFHWDRGAASIVAQLGGGHGWNFAGGAWFGTNFREAILEISGPEYLAATFPTDPAEYAVFNLSSEVARVVAASTTGSVTPLNVVRIAQANWIPGQFKPSVRKFYLENVDTDQIYFITGNTYDSLMIRAQAGGTPVAISQGDDLRIFTDRIVCTGAGGMVGSSPAPNLVDSEWQHPRHVRLRIPPRKYPEQHPVIETMVAGPVVPVAAVKPNTSDDPSTFDEAWRQIPTPLTEESAGASGVIAIAYLAPRPVQRWTFRYSAQEWYERDARFAHFASRMRDAFCIVFDSKNPVASAELVRRTFRTEGIEHVGGDLYDEVVELEEVV